MMYSKGWMSVDDWRQTVILDLFLFFVFKNDKSKVHSLFSMTMSVIFSEIIHARY